MNVNAITRITIDEPKESKLEKWETMIPEYLESDIPG